MNPALNAINILDAIEICDYDISIKDVIVAFMFEVFENSKSNIFLITRGNSMLSKNEKIILVQYLLPVLLRGKSYDVSVLIYIPTSFPKTPPELYLQRNENVTINPQLLGSFIDDICLRLKVENKIQWNGQNFSQMLQEISKVFHSFFPIYKGISSNPKNFTGNCVINPLQLTSVSFTAPCKSDLIMPCKQFSKEIIKNILLQETQSKLITSIKSQVEPLAKKRERLLQLKAKYSEEITKFKEIVDKKEMICTRISDISTEVQGHVKSLQDMITIATSANETNNQSLDNAIAISNEKFILSISKEASLEEFLFYIKKGYEKQIFSFLETIKLIRTHSKELFMVKYCRDKIVKF